MQNFAEQKFTFDHTLAAFLILLAGLAMGAAGFVGENCCCGTARIKKWSAFGYMISLTNNRHLTRN